MEKQRDSEVLWDDKWVSPAEFRSGARIGLALRPASSGPLCVVRLETDGSRRELLLPHPRGAIGGAEFVLSPTEMTAVLSYYSGQSEEAYEAFDVRCGGLRHVGGVGYVFGEGASFAFSEHDDRLLMACPQTCVEWWSLWENAELVADDPSISEFALGVFTDHDLTTGAVTMSELWVRAPNDWRPPETARDTVLRPLLVGTDVQVEFPWGQARLPLPLEKRTFITL